MNKRARQAGRGGLSRFASEEALRVRHHFSVGVLRLVWLFRLAFLSCSSSPLVRALTAWKIADEISVRVGTAAESELGFPELGPSPRLILSALSSRLGEAVRAGRELDEATRTLFFGGLVAAGVRKNARGRNDETRKEQQENALRSAPVR